MHTEKWPKDRAGYQGTLVILQTEKSLRLKPANFFWDFISLTENDAALARGENGPRFCHFAGAFE